MEWSLRERFLPWRTKRGCPIIPSWRTLRCVFPSCCQWGRLTCKQAEFVFSGLTDGGRQAAAELGCTAGVGILGLVRNGPWRECFPSSRWEETSDAGHKSVPAWCFFFFSTDYVEKMERNSFKTKILQRESCLLTAPGGVSQSELCDLNQRSCTRRCMPDVQNKCVVHFCAGQVSVCCWGRREIRQSAAR